MKGRLIAAIYIAYTSVLILTQLVCFWLYYWHAVLKHPVLFEDLSDYGFAITLAIFSGYILIPMVLLLDFILSVRNKYFEFHYWKAVILISVFVSVLLLQKYSHAGGWYLYAWDQ